MDPRVPVPDYARLLVRKFPVWLKSEDKESLLRCFGAVDVAVMSQNGRMVIVLREHPSFFDAKLPRKMYCVLACFSQKNCAFATFATPQDAHLVRVRLKHVLTTFERVFVGVLRYGDV